MTNYSRFQCTVGWIPPIGLENSILNTLIHWKFRLEILNLITLLSLFKLKLNTAIA